MEKETGEQLELFSQVQEDQAQKEGKGSLFSYIKGSEITLLILIGFIGTSILFFSLGVQKGKTIVPIAKDEPLAAAAIKPPAAPYTFISLQDKPVVQTATALPAPAAAKEKIIQKTPLMAKEKPLASSGEYTVQLASFKSKTMAEKEGAVLKKKGFTAIIIPKGKFTVLCVGRFTSKEKAQSALTEFKKQYADCCLRRL